MSRILIIEDDPSIAELQKDYLEMSGHEIIQASDGAQGLKYLQKNRLTWYCWI